MKCRQRIASAILAAALQISAFCGVSAEVPEKYKEANVVAKYSVSEAWSKGPAQGIDGWYYYGYTSNDAYELTYNSANNRWEGKEDPFPTIRSNEMTPGNSTDGGWRFQAPQKGMYRIRGSVRQRYKSNDGILATICKGSKVIWSENAKGEDIAFPYDEVVALKKGESIDFKVNCITNNSFKWIEWFPTVELLDAEYVAEPEDYTYYQKSTDGTVTQLDYNEEKDGYLAADGEAFVCSTEVMPTQKYSLIRRYIVPEEGRYRVFGSLEQSDKKGSGIVLTVYKNGEEVWKQLCPRGEKQTLDVRMMTSKDDIIDVEASIAEYEGYNSSSWDINATKYIGTLLCAADTSSGFSYDSKSEFTLGSLIGTSQGAKNTNIYSFKNDLKHEMTYNAQSNRWESPIKDDGAYVSTEVANTGVTSTTMIETVLQQDGILRIDGDLLVSNGGDGVLAKIYKNDNELIWSSRVGGERAVRWDEPFDVSYFLTEVNAVSKVNEGDKLTFTFNKWRKNTGDQINIKGITLKYVEDTTILSKTTKWKLDNSIVADTQNGVVKTYGTASSADVTLYEDTAYVSKEDLNKVLGSEATYSGDIKEITGKEYIPLRAAAEQNNKSVAWAADRYVLIYDGIPVLFGYPELSEIKTLTDIGGALQ